jgi:TM2 domain-containing membrane protein YozV
MPETQTSQTQTPAQAQAPAQPQTSTKPSQEAVARMTLVETRLANEKKSMVLAYILWFFFGTFGGHCFYLGKTGQGIIRLAAFVVALAMMMSGSLAASHYATIIFVVLAIWVLVDLFLIPRMIRQDTEQRRERLEHLLFS